jgi:hypothetical protein
MAFTRIEIMARQKARHTTLQQECLFPLRSQRVTLPAK